MSNGFSEKFVLSRGIELIYKKDIRTMMKCVIGGNRVVREVFDVSTKDLFNTKKGSI